MTQELADSVSSTEHWGRIEGVILRICNSSYEISVFFKHYILVSKQKDPITRITLLNGTDAQAQGH